MNIYVGNLDVSVGEQQLIDIFTPFGLVRNVRIMMDHGSNISKGFAFVEMMNRREGSEAIRKLDKMTFMSQLLSVCEARPNTTTPPGQNFSFRSTNTAVISKKGK